MAKSIKIPIISLGGFRSSGLRGWASLDILWVIDRCEHVGGHTISRDLRAGPFQCDALSYGVRQPPPMCLGKGENYHARHQGKDAEQEDDVNTQQNVRLGRVVEIEQCEGGGGLK